MSLATDWVRSQRKAWYFESWTSNPPRRLWVPPWLYSLLLDEEREEAQDATISPDLTKPGDDLLFRGIRVLPAWTEETIVVDGAGEKGID